MTKDVSDSPRSGRPYVSLRGRNSFVAAYEGERRTAGSVVVLVSEGSPGLPRAAFVAGKNLGNAVQRNRAKRRLRSAMARVRLQDGTVYVVIARPGVIEVPFDRLVGWLTAAVQQPRDASGNGQEK